MFEKILSKVRGVLYWFSCVAIMLMLIIIFCQVITRYCFGYTPEWSEELSRFLFVYVVFLGSALIMGESGHLAVEFLPNRFKGTAIGKLLDIIILICSYLFVSILLVQGTKMAQVMTFQESPGMGISMSYIYAVIPVSSVLMFMYLIRNTIRIIRGESATQDKTEDASH